MFSPGDVVVLEFPDVLGPKRRLTVVLSTDLYQSVRPDIIVGLITSQVVSAVGPTDYALQDWAVAGLRVPSAFRSFLATIPINRDVAFIGRFSERDWAGVQVRLALSLSFAAPPPPPP